MSDIVFNEWILFEDLFDMRGGYVLDLSNREFSEILMELLGFDVYQRCPGRSKAKILRQIRADCGNREVGKVLLGLMKYMKERGLINFENEKLFMRCREIGFRLIEKTQTEYTVVDVKKAENAKREIKYRELLNDLMLLTKWEESAQSRGFAFERFLNRLFQAFDLKPNGSFKITGEQIDGSFVLFDEVYLLEAKWRSEKASKADLMLFNSKVNSKSKITRGLFISYMGYSQEALESFGRGTEISIVLMTVQELAIALERKCSLQELLFRKIRALAERGEFFKLIV